VPLTSRASRRHVSCATRLQRAWLEVGVPAGAVGCRLRPTGGQDAARLLERPVNLAEASGYPWLDANIGAPGIITNILTRPPNLTHVVEIGRGMVNQTHENSCTILRTASGAGAGSLSQPMARSAWRTPCRGPRNRGPCWIRASGRDKAATCYLHGSVDVQQTQAPTNHQQASVSSEAYA
jgi:hypothetical protein